MIQATELRIGNYVLGQTKQITKVDGFFNNNKAIYTNVEDERVRFIIHYLNECEPIELTEEILLKCGFEFNEFSYVYEDETRVSVYVNDDFFFCQIDNVVINNINHLHQLQNLYWCLTNEELTINL